MNRENKILVPLILVVILMVVLSGCGGVKTAKINMTIDPNPVPYSVENERWGFTLILSESKGIGVTLTSLKIESYNQEDELIATTIWDEEVLNEYWETNYIAAFYSLQMGLAHKSVNFAYAIITVEGVDDNGNPIEATVRVDYLPK